MLIEEYVIVTYINVPNEIAPIVAIKSVSKPYPYYPRELSIQREIEKADADFAQVEKRYRAE